MVGEQGDIMSWEDILRKNIEIDVDKVVSNCCEQARQELMQMSQFAIDGLKEKGWTDDKSKDNYNPVFEDMKRELDDLDVRDCDDIYWSINQRLRLLKRDVKERPELKEAIKMYQKVLDSFHECLSSGGVMVEDEGMNLEENPTFIDSDFSSRTY